MLAFLVTVRPAWWVLRGWLAYFFVATVVDGSHLLPVSAGMGVLLVVAMVVSVQIGRGRWLSWPAFKGVLAVINVAAVIGAPFALGWAYANQESMQYAYEQEPYYPQGITRDGMQVSNIFAYGPDGLPLEGVQLFDQDGEPLDLAPDTSADYVWDETGGSLLVPSSAAPGRSGWNVVPLEKLSASSFADDGTLLKSATPRPVGFPYRAVQPLAGFDEATVAEE